MTLVRTSDPLLTLHTGVRPGHGDGWVTWANALRQTLNAWRQKKRGEEGEESGGLSVSCDAARLQLHGARFVSIRGRCDLLERKDFEFSQRNPNCSKKEESEEE